MTPRQATNVAHGIQKRVLNDYESNVLVHRNVYTLFFNYLRDPKKNPKGYTPEELYPLSFDKSTNKKNQVPYKTFWETLTNVIQNTKS